MKIEQMIAKSSVAGGRIASKGLGKITSGSSENDFVQDGLVVSRLQIRVITTRTCLKMLYS